MKLKTFYYHYNKPASRKAGRAVLTLHYNKTCHLINGLSCYVSTYTEERKKQPRLVIKGHAHDIDFNFGGDTVTAVIR